MMGLATSQISEDRLRSYIGHHRETAIIEQIEIDKKGPLTVNDIKNIIIKGETEYIFLGTAGDMYEAGEGYKENGFIELDQIQNIIDSKRGSPILGHTHPLSVYDNVGYSPKDIEKMRLSESELPAPMPPSFTDFIGSTMTENHFHNQGIVIKQRVYDPTGTWEYEIETANPATRLLLDFQKNLSQYIDSNLAESDMKIIKGLGLHKTHPSKLTTALKSNPSTATIGDKIDKLADGYMTGLSESELEILEKLAELEILCTGIAGSKKAGLDKGRVQEMIRDFIQLGQELGIKISYSPENWAC